MKIEIDTNKDSEEEIRHIVKMLVNLLGDNAVFQAEIAREEIIKKQSKSIFGRTSSDDSSPEVSDESSFADFSFLDDNKEEEKQSASEAVNESKEKEKAKAKSSEAEEEEEFDFSKLMEY